MGLTIFQGDSCLGRGTVADLAPLLAAARDRTPPLVAFDDETGRTVDLDLRGTAGDIAARYAEPDAKPRGRGRPKLGVAAKEVTLLPRHWDWLASQRGGASAALRRLTEAAMRAEAPDPRKAQEAAYRLATTLAGDRPGYEEAMRALFAGDAAALADHTTDWPQDIRTEVLRLAEGQD